VRATALDTSVIIAALLSWHESHEAALRELKGSAAAGKLTDRAHDRAEPCDRPRTQVVSVGESTWNHDGVRIAEAGFFVEGIPGVRAQDVAHCVQGVPVGI